MFLNVNFCVLNIKANKVQFIYLYVQPPPSSPSKTKQKTQTLLYMYSCVWMQLRASSTAHAWRTGQLRCWSLSSTLFGDRVLCSSGIPSSLAGPSFLGFSFLCLPSHRRITVLPHLAFCGRWESKFRPLACVAGDLPTEPSLQCPPSSGLEMSLLKEKHVGMNSVEFCLSVPWPQRSLQSQFPELYYDVNLQRRCILRCCFHEKVSTKM